MVWTFLSFCYGKNERGTTGRFSGPFIDEPIDRVAKRFFHIATRWRICRGPPLRDLPHARVQPLHPEIFGRADVLGKRAPNPGPIPFRNRRFDPRHIHAR